MSASLAPTITRRSRMGGCRGLRSDLPLCAKCSRSQRTRQLSTTSSPAVSSTSPHAARSPPAPASVTTGASSPATHVRQLVSAKDHASYLPTYFYPRGLQDHYLAIRAFNVELATVKEAVSSEILGRIRMGWWREAIRGAFENRPAKHPVILALTAAIQDPSVVHPGGGLVEDHFLRIIQAREDDLAAPFTPPTLANLEEYAEATSSRLLYLSLNLLGLSHPAIDELFSHLGKAAGLALTLQSVPFHAGLVSSHASSASGGPAPRSSITKGQRRLNLPAEYLQAHGVVEEEVYRKGADASGFKDAVFDTATRANDYLITARRLIREELGGKVPSGAIGPLVGIVPSRLYLRRLEKADFDLFAPELQAGNIALQKGWRLPWEMWRCSRTGTI